MSGAKSSEPLNHAGRGILGRRKAAARRAGSSRGHFRFATKRTTRRRARSRLVSDGGDSLVPNSLKANLQELEPMVGVEPTTYGLRNRCSTTELHWLFTLKKTKR